MSTDLKQLNKLKKNKKRNESVTEYEERLIKVSRVSKVTKGGKKISFRAIAVIGNKNGKVGIGVAKADDVIDAFKKAKTDARKNLISIELTKSLTISHDITGNFGACKVIMRPSIEGSGVIAGGAVRTVLELISLHSNIRNATNC
jgi:small subunit ribosomal protein S5